MAGECREADAGADAAGLVQEAVVEFGAGAEAAVETLGEDGSVAADGLGGFVAVVV